MDEQSAKELLAQYNEIWGVGKTFDITVNSNLEDVGPLLTKLHCPSSLTDEQKIAVFDGLDFASLLLSSKTEKYDNILIVIESVFDALYQAIKTHNMRKSLVIVESILMPIARERQISSAMEQQIKLILSTMQEPLETTHPVK